MSDDHERLAQAREAAGYATASEAANAMGVSVPGYIHHENGTRGISRAAKRYASFFRVSLEWLLSGRGTMKGRAASVQLVAYVGAGAVVHRVEGDTLEQQLGEVDLFRSEDVTAVRVRGTSQYPRYLDGETIIITREPVPAQKALGQYVVVELDDGRQLLKILRRGTTSNLFRLESHNAPPEEDVTVERVYVVKGSIM